MTITESTDEFQADYDREIDQWNLTEAQLAWEQEQDAIAEGRATELMHCYLCHLEQTGEPTWDSNVGPLRGVLRVTTSRGFDPTAVYHLNCGHGLI